MTHFTQPFDDVYSLQLPLQELLEKYDLLLTLHQQPPERTPARRNALRQIAARFPSALREWEGLSQGELHHRRSRVSAWLALLHSDPSAAQFAFSRNDAWLRYMLDLYICLRRLLVNHAEKPRQPGRRLSELAYLEVAARHGVSVDEVKQALFAPAFAQDP